MVYWARIPLACWGSLSLALCTWGFWHRLKTGANMKRPIIWLIPGVSLAVFILISTLNPSFEVMQFYDTRVLRPITPIPWLPSSALPAQTLSEFWLYFVIYLTGYNVALNVSSLRRLRSLLIILAINAVVIAVFGTLQKLSGTEMFFGLQKSPNPTFFGPFIYHNHWGAYACMSLSLCLGAAVWLSRHDSGRGFWHSPALLALIGAVLIVVAVPLSTSRSSTIMVILLALIVALFEMWRIRQKSRLSKQNPYAQSIALALALIVTLAATFALSAPVISQRIAKTREQISAMEQVGILGERGIIYQETLAMFQNKPWAGWGLESWELMFSRTTQLTNRGDKFTIHYIDAHSDWLQSLAEIGAIGTGLLLAMGVVPLWSTRKALIGDRTVTYLLIGNGAVLAYAWVEFPLANPAVVLIFWIHFFATLRYAQILRS